MKDTAEFTKALLAWFDSYGRKLPWREVTDPYKIWISEIMLQQTQVPRVEKTFYPNFLQHFPTVEGLVAASWEDVFPVWKGLGYYGRGKNMLKTAKIVVERHGGIFPQDQKLLEEFPGVGEYTARAILSFAFDDKVAAVDTNIQKIIHVLWPGKDVERLAENLISYSSSGRDWNGAMMDLASALRAGEKVEGDLGKFFPPDVAKKFLPVRKKKTLDQNPGSSKGVRKKSAKKKYRIEVGIACIHKDGKYLIQSRPEGKSFVGAWEFPGGKREKGEDFRGCVKREILEELGIEVSVRPHFYEEVCSFNRVDLLLRFHRCQIQKGTPEPLEGQKLQWVAAKDFERINFLKTNGKALEKLKGMKM